MATKRSEAGWTTVAFGDVVRQVKDKVSPEASGLERYIAGEHMDTDNLRIRRWGEIGDGYLGPAFHMRFKPGHVLYGSRRTYLRKVAVAGFEGITANTTYVLESADPKVLLPELLPFIMQTEAFVEHSVRESKGSVNPYVNFSDLAWFEFSLPPIEEQRRLSCALAGADSVADAHLRALLSLRVLRQSFVDGATKPQEDPMRLGDLCAMQNGRPFPGDEYCDDGILLLRPGNLSASGYTDWSVDRTKRLPARYLNEASDFTLSNGDVVINLTAQSLEDGFMGRVCLVQGDEPALLNQRIGRFMSFSSRLRPEFLYRSLQSSRFKAHAAAMCEGSKIKHLFWEHLERFLLSNLTPEQQEVVCARAAQIDNQIRAADERLHQAQTVKASLLRVVSEEVPGATS